MIGEGLYIYVLEESVIEDHIKKKNKTLVFQDVDHHKSAYPFVSELDVWILSSASPIYYWSGGRRHSGCGPSAQALLHIVIIIANDFIADVVIFVRFVEVH